MSSVRLALVLAALGLPLLFCALSPLLARSAPSLALRFMLATAGLPALALGLLPAGEGATLSWLLLGTTAEVSTVGRAVLLLTGIAWSLAGWFAGDRVKERLATLTLWWLLSLFGVVLTAIAGDPVSFYFGYAVMSLAAYGLITHRRSLPAMHAGRVYLAMAIVGESAVLAGLILTAHRYGLTPLAELSPATSESTWGVEGPLLLFGFGMKVGIAGLHVWLPLAHPAAPVPASAVLSGVIVKVGALGLVQWVPVASMPQAALLALVGVGLFTAFYAGVVGLFQVRLKTTIAYSTVSQMGLVFVATALALAGPDREGALAVVALWILHHGLNKAALFVGAGGGPATGAARVALWALPALSLVGAPLLSGAVSKSALKGALAGLSIAEPLTAALGASSIVTGLLMWRAFGLARADSGPRAPIHPAWPALVVAGIAVPWLWTYGFGMAAAPSPSDLWHAAWPLGLSGALIAGWRRWLSEAGERLAGRVPEGDVLVPILRSGGGVRQWLTVAWPQWPVASIPPLAMWVARGVRSGERRLGTIAAAGIGLLSLLSLLWLAWRDFG